jgi:DNA-binding transcriptional ArsR family regulator
MDAFPSAEVFRALGDTTRRGIFERLAREGGLSVGAITAGAGVSQPAVSQHLKALRAVGLVAEARAGRSIIYSADPQGLKPLVDWVSEYGEFWLERFDRLEKLLREMDQ